MTTTTLVALAFAVWSAMGVRAERAPDAQGIAEALAEAVVLDYQAGRAPIGTSYAEDVAVQAYWAFRESSLQRRALGDGGRSRGPWQLQGAAGMASLGVQAAAWRALVREVGGRCQGSPYAILWGGCAIPLSVYGRHATTATAAARRVQRSRQLLVTVLEGFRE